MADVHPMVEQLRFTRSEFKRGLRGLKEDEAIQRFMPMNSISWNVGHLTWQEQRYCLHYGLGMKPLPYPEINKAFAYGAPASTPPLKDVLDAWKDITKQADTWLDTLTTELLASPVPKADGSPSQRTYGSLILRMIYHYWYHCGENLAIRQNLGHTGLPQFVGNIDDHAPYRPEQ